MNVHLVSLLSLALLVIFTRHFKILHASKFLVLQFRVNQSPAAPDENPTRTRVAKKNPVSKSWEEFSSEFLVHSAYDSLIPTMFSTNEAQVPAILDAGSCTMHW